MRAHTQSHGYILQLLVKGIFFKGHTAPFVSRPNLEWAWKAAMFALPVPFSGKRVWFLSWCFFFPGLLEIATTPLVTLWNGLDVWHGLTMFEQYHYFWYLQVKKWICVTSELYSGESDLFLFLHLQWQEFTVGKTSQRFLFVWEYECAA